MPKAVALCVARKVNQDIDAIGFDFLCEFLIGHVAGINPVIKFTLDPERHFVRLENVGIGKQLKPAMIMVPEDRLHEEHADMA